MNKPIYELDLPKGTKWSKTNILAGFHKFFAENNRLPTAHEIDAIPYLPSSRQIQRKFGGLQELREELGFKIRSFSEGEIRRQKAIEINVKGHRYENYLQDELVKYFGEEFVHNEKSFKTTRAKAEGIMRVDFYVYSSKGSFAVDIFHSQDKYSLIGSINHKLKIYTGLKYKIYLVLYTDNLNQEQLQVLLKGRRSPTAENIEIVCYDYFLSEIISKWTPYPSLESMYEAYKRTS